MTAVVLPHTDLAVMLVNATNLFFETHLTNPPKMNLKQASQVIWNMTDDYLNIHQVWATQAAVATVKHLAETFPWMRIKKNKSMTQRYLEEIIAAFEDMINDFLEPHIAPETWDVWYMSQMGTGLLVRKEGDYRIIEWERMTDYQPTPKKKQQRIVEMGTFTRPAVRLTKVVAPPFDSTKGHVGI